MLQQRRRATVWDNHLHNKNKTNTYHQSLEYSATIDVLMRKDKEKKQYIEQ